MHACGGLLVKTCGRLVQNQRFRLACDHAGDRHQSLLAARQVERRTVSQMFDMQQPHGLHGAFHRLGRIQSQVGRPVCDVFGHGVGEQLPFRMLHDVADRTIILGKPAKRADSKESTESTVKATCEEEPDAESSVDAAGSDTATVGERRTLLERLDPRVGMLSALALMFSAFAIGSFWQLLLAVVFTGVIAAAGRINVGRLAASVRVFLALFVFCGLLNIFFVRTGTTVASLGPIPITDDGIRIAILYACRFAVVIVIGAMFLASTTPTAMTDAFESLLSPFARFGLHTQETALVMSLALRFLPTLGVETKAIIDAQSARGGSVETGSFVVRIKAMVAVVVPVFAAAIRHADNLSLALDARCYEEGATRTHWRVMRVTGMDVAVAIVVLVYLVALVVPGVLL